MPKNNCPWAAIKLYHYRTDLCIILSMAISIERARRLIGKEAKKYTDEQIEEIIRTFTVLADMAIDNVVERKKIGKK